MDTNVSKSAIQSYECDEDSEDNLLKECEYAYSCYDAVITYCRKPSCLYFVQNYIIFGITNANEIVALQTHIANLSKTN